MKLTQKHFEIFKKSCEYWIDELKLDNWEVHYRWRKSRENRASMNTNLSGYIATMFLSREWSNYDKITKKEIEEEIKTAAKHEIIHLLLARLSGNGSSRFISSDDLVEAEEELVRKLEKIL